VIKIIEKERPDALLPTLGGQTALNTALEVATTGALEKYGVELIGAKVDVIKRAEDRILFKEAMVDAKVECLRSKMVGTLEEAEKVALEIGFPVIVRPSFTLGGTGGGTAMNMEELLHIARGGLAASLNHTVLLEESILGWKEFELEVMRDRKDNCVIVCSIENVDPMGIHTGDSVTVAPVQTLTDREYQVMRDAAIRVMRVIGVETGGSNVQFALNPKDGRMVVIEMNPRVSRSSRWPPRPPGSPSPRSRPSWPWATRWTKFPTTSRARPRPASSRPWTTAWSSSRASPSKSSPAPKPSWGQHEVRGRDHGHRQQLQGGLPEGSARTGDRLRRLRPEAGSQGGFGGGRGGRAPEAAGRPPFSDQARAEVGARPPGWPS
jgi:hypothetical protein